MRLQKKKDTHNNVISIIKSNPHAVIQEHVKYVLQCLEEKKVRELQLFFNSLHAADAGAILNFLTSKSVLTLIHMLGENFHAEILLYLNETVREQVFDQWAKTRLVYSLSKLDHDDLREIFSEMDDVDRYTLLRAISPDLFHILVNVFKYPEDTAGRLMRIHLIALKTNWSVRKACEFISKAKNTPEDLSHIYISDEYRLVGQVSLLSLFRADKEKLLQEIMEPANYSVNAYTDLSEVYQMFLKYNLISVPIIDDKQCLVGEIKISQILEFAHRERDEEILMIAGGIDISDFYENFWNSTRIRIVPLMINLIMNFITSIIVTTFESTLYQIAALATLMNIVPAIGGNAGSQVLAVTVRALANGEIGQANYKRTILKELLVGITQGLILGAIVGVVVLKWKQSISLSFIFGVALCFNVIWGSLMGIFIPLTFHYLGYDAALSASFLTNITDWIGYIVVFIMSMIVLKIF